MKTSDHALAAVTQKEKDPGNKNRKNMRNFL